MTRRRFPKPKRSEVIFRFVGWTIFTKVRRQRMEPDIDSSQSEGRDRARSGLQLESGRTEPLVFYRTDPPNLAGSGGTCGGFRRGSRQGDWANSGGNRSENSADS